MYFAGSRRFTAGGDKSLCRLFTRRVNSLEIITQKATICRFRLNTPRRLSLIINRYILLEIVKPQILICGVLVAIYASFSSAAYLADAAHGLLSGLAVVKLTLLKTIIGLEALLPTAFYLAVVVGLGRLYGDTEMTALSAAGFSELQLVKAITWLGLITALIVGVLTLYIRPWAYLTVYKLEAQALAELDINKLESGRFYKLGQTGNVLFAGHIDRDKSRLEDVFFRGSPNLNTRIIRAREAYLSSTEAGTVPIMIFVDGHGYDLDNKNEDTTNVEFNKLALYLYDFAKVSLGYKRKAESLASLMKSEQPGDLAEYQWRLSMPLVTLILGLLAVPLSRSRPRQSRYAKLFVAILMFALYYNLLSIARTWVDQGRLGAFPGLWWAHVIPVLVLAILLAQPYFRLLTYRSNTNDR